MSVTKDKFKAKCREKGFASDYELAKASHLGRDHISRIVNGLISSPKSGTLEQIATAFAKRSGLPVTDELQELKKLFAQSLDNNGRKKIVSTHQHHGKMVRMRVFISYYRQTPDLNLAQQFSEILTANGHISFMAEKSFQVAENWLQRLDEELQQCDCLLLFLSTQSALSEMVIEEVRQARELQVSCAGKKPFIFPVRVRLPLEFPLNHDLRGYLQGIPQREWHSSADTLSLVRELLNFVREVGEFGVPPGNQGNGEMASGAEFALTPNSQLFVNSTPPLDPPLPVAEPELPVGQVPLTSIFYVKRPPTEERCYEEILQPGALIRIKAPRQMGKTSLMARILYQAREHGYQTVPLSLQLADRSVFVNLDTFLRWFCERVGWRLKQLHLLDNYWQTSYGSKDKSTAYFEECLLTNSASPIVLGLDEVDRVFPHQDIADDFFSLLRAWYEHAKYGDHSSEIWQKLRVVVVHSTEVYIPLDMNQSPFNVGLNIELQEFTLPQVQDLVGRHDGLNWTANQVETLMDMVGGHPYLLRLALYHIQRQDVTLQQLLQTAPTEAGIYSDHLRRHLWHLKQHPKLLAAFKQVVTALEPVELDLESAFKLHSVGLVNQQENKMTPRCNLYRQYFSNRLS